MCESGQLGACFWPQRRISECSGCAFEVSCDHLFDLIDRSRASNRALQHLDLFGIKVRIADELVKHPLLRGGKSAACDRDKNGALALREIISRWLTSDLLVAEHAQEVVSKLKGHTDRKPEIGEGLLLLCAGASERCADEKRRLDAVFRGLVDQYPGGSCQLFLFGGK